jgi:predicted dehydrogenase
MKINKTSRREFLKRSTQTAIAAVTFPYIIPSSAIGKSGTIPPSEKTTMGFIGVGGMGTGNLWGFVEKSDAHVVAVCDVDTFHRNRAKDIVNEEYGNQDCATYNDFRELLDRKDLDAVCIALPDHWHALAAVAAAKKGYDIYAEKPLAYTISEGRAIVDAVKKYNIVWQTGSQQRSDRHFRFACELVRNGYIGDVKLVKVGLPYGNSLRQGNTKIAPVPDGFDYDMWLGPAPYVPYSPARCHWNFRWNLDYSGGQLTDWAGHHIDIAQWGMNTELSAPVEIEGEGVYPKAEEGLFDTPDAYRFECKYKEGFTMIVADNHQNKQGAYFEGSEGWIHVNRGGIETHPKSLLHQIIKPDEIHLYKSLNHRKNFLDCVRTRGATVAPAKAAHRSIMVAHLGGIAMRLGRKIYFDPKKEKFVNDAEADGYLSRAMREPWHL